MHTAWRMFAENLIWLKKKTPQCPKKTAISSNRKIQNPTWNISMLNLILMSEERINHLKAKSCLSISDHDLVTVTLF